MVEDYLSSILHHPSRTILVHRIIASARRILALGTSRASPSRGGLQSRRPRPERGSADLPVSVEPGERHCEQKGVERQTKSPSTLHPHDRDTTHSLIKHIGSRGQVVKSSLQEATRSSIHFAKVGDNASQKVVSWSSAGNVSYVPHAVSTAVSRSPSS